MFPGSDLFFRWQEQGSHRFPRKDPGKNVGVSSVCHHGGDPHPGCPFCCHNLGGHSTGTTFSGSSRHIHDLLVDLFYHLDQFSFTQPGVTVEQPFSGSKNNKEVGIGEVDHHGGEKVIITEPDLVHGNSIVLVDHRDNSQLQ